MALFFICHLSSVISASYLSSTTKPLKDLEVSEIMLILAGRKCS